MGRRTAAAELSNTIQARRAERGLSQQDLAQRAGVTRQAVNAIEAGRYTPNAVVAIRLAQALDCRVEELFRVREPLLDHEVRASGETLSEGDRVVIGRVGREMVAHPLAAQRAAPEGFAPADGVAQANGMVRAFTPGSEIERTAFIVGCDPSLGMLASMVTRRARSARLVWLPGSSKAALDALRGSLTHVAGLHLRDAASGECNLAQAAGALTSGGAVVGYAAWEQGFMVRPGNPKSIKGIDSVARRGVRLVNRETGAGSRVLLEQLISRAGIDAAAIPGYDRAVTGHMAVARAIVEGSADVGVGLRAVAELFELDFVPIASVKFDLAIPEEHLRHPAIEVMLDVLQSGLLRAELTALAGYDCGETGSVRGTFPAAA